MNNFANQYKQKLDCRICHATDLKQYLSFGDMPLVNSYVHPKNSHQKDPVYPLVVDYCPNCSMSQLSIVVEPSVMFSNYFYRSSVSDTFVKHCNQFAKDTVKRFGISGLDIVVDIGSNDGACLREFKKNGVSVLGIEPAKNLAKLSIESGVPAISNFWNAQTAEYALAKHRPAKLITAMNVFAHTDDLDSFLVGINTLLDNNGIFIIECPYMFNLMREIEFDTIYHEHLSYFLLKPIMYIMGRHNLEVFDAVPIDIHGGTIRIYVKKKASNAIGVEINQANIDKLLQMEQEMGMYDMVTYLNFAQNVNKIRDDFTATINKLKAEGKKIAAYGASAKGNILINFCHLGEEDIDYIIDDTPEKQGYLAPGCYIPIVSASALEGKNALDYLILTAWNFAAEIMKKTKKFKKAGGKYIIPIPEVKII